MKRESQSVLARRRRITSQTPIQYPERNAPLAAHFLALGGAPSGPRAVLVREINRVRRIKRPRNVHLEGKFSSPADARARGIMGSDGSSGSNTPRISGGPRRAASVRPASRRRGVLIRHRSCDGQAVRDDGSAWIAQPRGRRWRPGRLKAGLIPSADVMVVREVGNQNIFWRFASTAKWRPWWRTRPILDRIVEMDGRVLLPLRSRGYARHREIDPVTGDEEPLHLSRAAGTPIPLAGFHGSCG